MTWGMVFGWALAIALFIALAYWRGRRRWRRLLEQAAFFKQASVVDPKQDRGRS